MMGRTAFEQFFRLRRPFEKEKSKEHRKQDDEIESRDDDDDYLRNCTYK